MPSQFNDKFFPNAGGDIFRIEDGFEINGSIVCRNGRPMVFDGVLNGSIASNGLVLVGENARINGSIRAHGLEIRGQVNRTQDSDIVEVEGVLRLESNAEANIDISAGSFSMSRGAVVGGNVNTFNRPMVVNAQAVEVKSPPAQHQQSRQQPSFATAPVPRQEMPHAQHADVKAAAKVTGGAPLGQHVSDMVPQAKAEPARSKVAAPAQQGSGHVPSLDVAVENDSFFGG